MIHTAQITKVYIASPYEDSPIVARVAEKLYSFGISSTSYWALQADGRKEDQSRSTPEDLRSYALRNDADVLDSDAVVVLARPGTGGEMFAEARFALIVGKPVIWVGRKILSTWREGVTWVEDSDDAVSLLRDHNSGRFKGGLASPGRDELKSLVKKLLLP